MIWFVEDQKRNAFIETGREWERRWKSLQNLRSDTCGSLLLLLPVLHRFPLDLGVSWLGQSLPYFHFNIALYNHPILKVNIKYHSHCFKNPTYLIYSHKHTTQFDDKNGKIN